MTTFQAYILGMHMARATSAQDVNRFFAPPNTVYQIALGQREPDKEDFVRLSAYLDIPEEYLMRLYTGEAEIPKMVTPRVGGG